MEKLDRIAKKSRDENHRRDAAEMVAFYIRNGYLPARLTNRAIELTSINKDVCKRSTVEKKSQRFYLYAISDGEMVKVGYSVNPKSRLKTMQVGNPRKIEIVWRKYCASSTKEAIKQERKLHRAISGHSIRGEWFSIGAMNRILKWRVMGYSAKIEEESIALDEELISSVPANF
jgi:hypothetical protein